VLIALTEAGLRVWENTISVQDRVERQLVDVLRPDEQDQLVSLLRRLLLATQGHG
jgi:DNA-binding MarR family transcriptional regulator